MDKRDRERRSYLCNTSFPLLTRAGLIPADRRRQPDRRLNNIRAQYFGCVRVAVSA